MIQREGHGTLPVWWPPQNPQWSCNHEKNEGSNGGSFYKIPDSTQHWQAHKKDRKTVSLEEPGIQGDTVTN